MNFKHFKTTLIIDKNEPVDLLSNFSVYDL